MCKQLIKESQGEYLHKVFSDSGISGQQIETRPGLEKMLLGLRHGEFTVLIAEGLDRISRSLVDIARIASIAEFRNCEIRTITEGENIGSIHIGLKGTMNALFLKDHAMRTKRGHSGNIRDGKVAGGHAYEYKIVYFNPDGKMERGLRAVDADQAKIIQEIFTRFTKGHSPNLIAKSLNERAIPTARGGKWSSGTIIGTAGRPRGILRNPIYKGILAYNRLSQILNPETGQKEERINPQSEWVTQYVPHLRIIDDELWMKAQAILATYDQKQKAAAKKRRKSYLQTIGKCVCGGKLSIHDKNRLKCARAKRFACEDTTGYGTKQLPYVLIQYIAKMTIDDIYLAIETGRDIKAHEREKGVSTDEIYRMRARANQIVSSSDPESALMETFIKTYVKHFDVTHGEKVGRYKQILIVNVYFNFG